MDNTRSKRAALGGVAVGLVANKVIGKSTTESAFLGVGTAVVLWFVWDNTIYASPETNITIMPVDREKNYM